MLNIVNVSKFYAKNPILKNVNFYVEKGSIVGLAGPSGSGKSTLLRCIQKLENVDEGSVDYVGTSSLLFQDFQLFPHLTVLENLTYAPKYVFNEKNCEKSAFDLLVQLGLKEKVHVYPSKLSGGQKQRAALARCLMIKPDILLCDEPTSGLDVATIIDVVDLLKSIHQRGVTMIIASHDLDFLTRISQNIIVLKKGIKAAEMLVSEVFNPIEHLKLLYQETA